MFHQSPDGEHDFKPAASVRRCPAAGGLPLLLLGLLLGCAGPRLMPTPNAYLGADRERFTHVAEPFRTNTVDLLYVTDRVLESVEDGGRRYGYRRSPSLAFGSCVVGIGRGLSWDELVAESTRSRRTQPLPLTLRWVEERGRFPETPYPIRVTEAGTVREPAVAAMHEAAVSALQAEVRRRLALTPRKEAYVFVHGFNNDFRWAAGVTAQLWHFLPREGVPILYTWPAGRGGLRGYTYDRESSEFTIHHFKQFLRALLTCPDLGKIHLIAHSRGTDVAATGVRELVLEMKAPGEVTRRLPKLENVVLLAPDMDLQVASQRVTAEAVELAARRFTVYVCAKDRAVNLANWLFEGLRRLGQIRVHDFTPEQRDAIRQLRSVNIIDARVPVGFLGHGYFHSSPAVSSDLIRLLREGCDPGTPGCRPLPREEDLFWKITADYLAPPAEAK